jgi:crotonobetainyl-CoA:carnitine CoA-transferase CaiB-like acyl-CoA transferase
MPGLGSTGPLSHYGTWGPTLTAYSGLTHLWNHPNQERPIGSQGVYPDYLTGVMAPLAVVAALLRRKKSGQGALLDLAQVEAAAYMLGATFLDVIINKRDATPIGNDWPYAAPHNCYRCFGEDRWCVIAVENDAQWSSLCDALGQPALACDPRFRTFQRRREHLAELDACISAWTETRDAFEVMRQLQSAGVPCGVVQNGADLAADSHLRDRGFIQTVHHPVLGEIPMAGLPLHFREGGNEPYVSPPPLGADNEYLVCGVLGHSAEDLERWQTQQVVF